jgi:ankyrin repeat protein
VSELPPRPSVEHLKKQAKDLLRAFRAGDADAVRKLRPPGAPSAGPKLADARLAVARDYGFPSWPKLVAHVEAAVAGGPSPFERAKAAFHNQDADLLRQLLRLHPELKPLLNEPLLSFDSPPVLHARTREMLDILLEAGADINARSRWWAGGFGVLDNAAPDLAAYAISRGAKVDANAASHLGMLDQLRALVDADPSLVHARGGDGQTPLHVAATPDIADFLLDRGAEIDALDVDHESTPAMYAVRDRPAVARRLVARGCRTDILLAAALGDAGLVRQHLARDPASIRTTVSPDYFPMANPRAGGTIYIWTIGANKTPHAAARQFGHEAVYRLLMDHSPDDLKLAVACEVGDEATFEALTRSRPGQPPGPNGRDLRKVADAARDNNAAAVRLMLKAGWPADARGQHNATPLHWAAWHGNADLVAAVLAHRPPLEDSANDFGATPLGWATHGSENGWHRDKGDYVATVQLLCEAGAKLPEKVSGTEPVRQALRRFKSTRGA